MNSSSKIERRYSEVILLPEYSDLKTRSEADTSFSLGQKTFAVPVVPSNMKAVMDFDTAKRLCDNNYFYIMHRFDLNPVKFCESTQEWNCISISIGVQEQDRDNIMLLSRYGLRVDYVTIDIAHGHSILMKETIEFVKKNLPNTFVIAGNVATSDAVKDLQGWGADCIKVGIGQGSVCTTKDKTGFTRPMFSCVLDCASVSKVPIIADGGIKSNGDIAKALVAGGDMVMAGSLFSSCTDSPAASVVVNNRIYKQYFGSASEHNKGHKKHVEGVMKEVPSNNMSYIEKFAEIKQDLQSSISYSGGKDLSCFYKTKWRPQNG